MILKVVEYLNFYFSIITEYEVSPIPSQQGILSRYVLLYVIVVCESKVSLWLFLLLLLSFFLISIDLVKYKTHSK